jgi:hypothetical protein
MRMRRTLQYTVPASDGRRSVPEVHTRFSAARRESPEASVVRFRFAKNLRSFPFRKRLEVSDAFGRFSEGLFPFRKVPRADAGERGGVHDRPAGEAGRRRRWQGGDLRRVSAEALNRMFLFVAFHFRFVADFALFFAPALARNV